MRFFFRLYSRGLHASSTTVRNYVIPRQMCLFLALSPPLYLLLSRFLSLSLVLSFVIFFFFLFFLQDFFPFFRAFCFSSSTGLFSLFSSFLLFARKFLFRTRRRFSNRERISFLATMTRMCRTVSARVYVTRLDSFCVSNVFHGDDGVFFVVQSRFTVCLSIRGIVSE